MPYRPLRIQVARMHPHLPRPNPWRAARTFLAELPKHLSPSSSAEPHFARLRRSPKVHHPEGINEPVSYGSAIRGGVEL